MPAYLFTYHAYGSWLPNRPQGFVQRNQGVQPKNPALARSYREAMRHAPVLFGHHHFDYLMNVYLPKRQGLGWFEGRGWYNRQLTACAEG